MKVKALIAQLQAHEDEHPDADILVSVQTKHDTLLSDPTDHDLALHPEDGYLVIQGFES